MINRALIWTLGLTTAALLLPGCSTGIPRGAAAVDADLAHYQAVATRIEYPDVETPRDGQPLGAAPPITIDDEAPPQYWDLSLQDALNIALANSAVLRDFGGLLLPSPQNVRTVQGPAIRETDPQSGVDAALSAFDASFQTNAVVEKNDRMLNNLLFFGGRAFKQDLATVEMELSKLSASGAKLAVRHGMDYDYNNTPGNPLPSAWQTRLEAELRQPLLQGAGVEFNRTAGPNAAPGVYNGVLIARVNTDISLADFELGVRNLAADVESQYWELYFAYRDLDAKIDARERALETWRRIQALYQARRLGGEAEKEAQAREQYFRLEEEVQDALAGHQFQKSRTIPFAFRGNNGVHANERELRLLMGIPINDGRLIRPCQEPAMAKVLFDWEEILCEALFRRPELRRQKWQVKRRAMELAASRNFLYPRLDAFGQYRWRGFGQNLVNSTPQTDRFDNAYQDLTTGDFQEWQMGLELSLPVGYRQGHAAVRNAQLQLARECAVLREQERDVTHDLASAVAEMNRAYAAAQTSFNRRIAGEQQLAALEAVYDDADENQKTRLLDLLLDAQRRLADAESRFHRSLAEYALAVSQVHLQKGSLLEYNHVQLSEGPWPGEAYADAARRESLRCGPRKLCNYVLNQPDVVSRGAYSQRTQPVIDDRCVETQPATPAQPPADSSADPPSASSDARVYPSTGQSGWYR